MLLLCQSWLAPGASVMPALNVPLAAAVTLAAAHAHDEMLIAATNGLPSLAGPAAGGVYKQPPASGGQQRAAHLMPNAPVLVGGPGGGTTLMLPALAGMEGDDGDDADVCLVRVDGQEMRVLLTRDQQLQLAQHVAQGGTLELGQ
jgi:hypothetical protein